MRFSIILPTYNRADGRLQRAINSVLTQTFEDFELIIVDDGSKDATQDIVYEMISDFNALWVGYRDCPIRYIETDHRGRVIARNIGMQASTGDWICWLDSDDAYDPMYLATIDYNAQLNPDAHVFVVGVIVHGMYKDRDGKHICPLYTDFRKPWVPPIRDGKHVVPFNSGRVGTGMFVYSREAYEKIGPMPDWANHNKVADGIDEWLELPPGTTGYGSDRALHPKGHVGNPFGDDHCYFARLCQFYIAHALRTYLYIHYKR